jgi:Ca-activated chloride channel homolog
MTKSTARRRTACRIAVVAACLTLLAGPGPAQDRPRRVTPPQGDDAIELRSDLVTLTVSVAEGGGRPVGGLKADDFRIFEDGKPQKIEYFENVGDPYSLMLVLDTSGSTSTQVDRMRQAASEFVGGLSAEDRLGIISFSRNIDMLGDLTSDRSALTAHLASVGPTKSRDPKKGRFDESTGTSFYDALYLACAESPLAEETGSRRKAVVVFSDCVDSSSTYTFEQIKDVVEKSGMSLYVLLFDTEDIAANLLTQPTGAENRINFSESQLQRFYDNFAPDSPDRGRDPRTLTSLERLEINHSLYELAGRQADQLASRTGGRVYPVASIADLGSAYRTIAAELRTRYSIGYYPTNPRHDGTWRKLRVEIPSQPRAAVVARPGYWAPKK